MDFLEYELTSSALCMGERVRGGLFRPCDQRTVRYSVITGALKEYMGYPVEYSNIHAAGYLEDDEEHNQVAYLTYSPHDNALGKSKVPITTQFLTNVLAKVFVKQDDINWPKVMEFFMGALRTKGFGRVELRYKRTLDASQKGLRKRGRLKTRIPHDLLGEFGITKVDKPIYGYLLRPTSPNSGIYVLSLFENSLVVGPEFLLEEAKK